MRKLIESTFVTLGGDIGAPQEWGPPCLSGAEQGEYLRELLFGADALLLGRKTYEGLSAAYLAMAASSEPGPTDGFVDRMNAFPKYVASRTLAAAGWNATLLTGDVAARVAELKAEPGQYLLKYGTGPLDRTLVEHGLIDEFRIWIVPVTNQPGPAAVLRARAGRADARGRQDFRHRRGPAYLPARRPRPGKSSLIWVPS